MKSCRKIEAVVVNRWSITIHDNGDRVWPAILTIRCNIPTLHQYINAVCVGLSPLVPNGDAKNEPSELFILYQVPSDGRKTERSALPSPSKSPGAGMSVDMPNGYAV